MLLIVIGWPAVGPMIDIDVLYRHFEMCLKSPKSGEIQLPFSCGAEALAQRIIAVHLVRASGIDDRKGS